MGRCCAKPLAKIIRVGDTEAGILGLDQVFEKIHASANQNEQEVKDNLLRLVKEFGNYIAPSKEKEYKEALFREYLEYHLQQPQPPA